MNILILGGTGAMGTHLVDILSCNLDNKIFVTTRKNRVAEKENVAYITGDAHDNTFVSSVLFQNKWDVIVDFMSYSTAEFAFRAEKMLSACGQYIFLSSARVYADSKEPITEQSPRLLEVCGDKDYLATDEYALAKARQENILFESRTRHWTIIRPYITYSETRLQLGVLEKESWLYAVLNCGALVFSKDIARHVTTLTYGYDVAMGIATLIGNEKAFGEVFHITGSTPCRWQSVFEIYAQVLKSNGIVFEEFLKERTYRLNGVGKYQVIYDRYYDRIFDNSKIAGFVDVASFTTPQVGLAKSLEAFLKDPVFNYTNIWGGVVRALRGTGRTLPFCMVKGTKQKIKYLLIKMHLH